MTLTPPLLALQLSLTRLPRIPTIQTMYILTRYVVWEVLKYFLAALVGLTLIFTLGIGVQKGLGMGLPPAVMMRTMPYMLPEMLGITIPVAMLFSVCTVFGRMTGANEVVALKSLGINPMAVVWPAIVLAAFLSLGTVWMYEIAATWCRPSVARIVGESIEEIAYSMLQKSRSYDCYQFSITVKRVDTAVKPGENPRLIQPTIILKGPPRVTLTASQAVLRTDWKAHLLWIECRHSDVDIQRQGIGKIGMLFPGTEQYSVPIVVPGRPRYHRDWVAMSDIPDLIVELQTTLRQLERLSDAKRPLGIPDSPDDVEKISEYRNLIFRLKTEPYRRWSNGFACLCFALIGTPVAMLLRHADVLTNFFVCFLPILSIYYPLLMLGEDLSTSGKLPPVAFWMDNAILVIPAVLLLRRIVRR